MKLECGHQKIGRLELLLMLCGPTVLEERTGAAAQLAMHWVCPFCAVKGGIGFVVKSMVHQVGQLQCVLDA